MQSFLVGAEALKPQLTEAGADQGPTVKETVGVQLRTERHERRFGDDRLIEVKKGRTHATMLGPRWQFLRCGHPMKAIVQSCAESVRAINTTWSLSRKCIDAEGTRGCSLRTTATTRRESGSAGRA